MYNHVFLPSIFVCCICIFICSCGHFRISYNFPFNLSFISPPCFRFIFFYLDFIWWGLVGCQEQSNTFIFLPLEENIPKFTICLSIFYLLQKFMCHHKSLNFVHTWKHVFTQKYVRWIWIRFNSHMYFDVGPRGDKILED